MAGHSRNPGYIPGDHWVECDVCGFEYRHSVMKERWDNLVVCPQDYEVRHPQDFVRGREEDQNAKGLQRSQTNEAFIDNPCFDHSAIPNKMIPGCILPGRDPDNYSPVPPGSFTI